MTSKFEQRMGRDLSPDEILRHRFAALGYYDTADDTGSGSALDALASAATALGSTYIASQGTAPYAVNAPINTLAPYGAPPIGAPTATITGSIGSGSVLVIGGLLLVGLLIFAVMR